MKQVLIIGSGISGLSCAIETARLGNRAILASPYPSERAQSVMAAGGINAVLDAGDAGDSIARHVEDTISGGCGIASRSAVERLCASAPDIIRELEQLGTVFTRDENGGIARRAFGGQSFRRTVYAGASTGKQVMSALIREARKYECEGRITRRLGLRFHSALLQDGVCFGALMYSETGRVLEPIYADSVVMATGGQNGIFGKTTGSALCDGYAAGKLFRQGAHLKNLEFIQYHPTTIETAQKRMLITEAARGEGGRLYYEKDGRRVYFMEERFGPRGNLMPRDVVAKCIYDAPGQVYLDIAFLGAETIGQKLSEVEELCRRYAGLDVTRESIPVAPSVHYFMGGLAVDHRHRTNLQRLYAVGECAAIYHGANRLGGNSLLSALHGGREAARDIAQCQPVGAHPDFRAYIAAKERELAGRLASASRFSAVYILRELAVVMNESLGITRNAAKLREGMESVDYYLSICDRLVYDSDISPYQGYSLKGMLTLARAILTAAEARRESRGAHIREDFPERREEFCAASRIAYDDGNFPVTWEKED